MNRPEAFNQFLHPSGCPEKRNVGFIKVNCVRLGERQEIVCLGERAYGFQMHWDGFRSRPCLSPHNRCWCCDTRLTTVWKAYLASYDLVAKARRLTQITEGAWQNCPELKAQENLKGRHLVITRVGKTNNAPMRVQLLPEKRTIAASWDFDVLEVLCKLWGMSQLVESKLVFTAEQEG